MELKKISAKGLFEIIEKGDYFYGEETKAAKEIFERINTSYFFVESKQAKLQSVLIEKIKEQIEHSNRPNLYFISRALEIIVNIGNEKTLAELSSIILSQKNLPDRFEASKLSERLYAYMNEMNREAYLQEHLQKSKEKITSSL